MNAFALHDPGDRFAILRWGGSTVLIAALHAALILAGINWYHQTSAPGGAMPTIMIDMAPASAAPEPQPMDAASGPEMQQADASSPPPEPMPTQPLPHVEEQIAPTPLMEKPTVEAPPEQTIEPPPKTEPEKIIPDPPKPVVAKPVIQKPKPVRPPAKKESEDSPAPRTTAPPRAERQGRAVSVATFGAAAAAVALPSYRDQLAAHLQRYKQYPSEAKAAGKEGTAMLSFTVNRTGQVLGSRLAGSSGVPALDAETLAMIRRAQPLPSFPPEMTQGSLSFTVPVRFSIR